MKHLVWWTCVNLDKFIETCNGDCAPFTQERKTSKWLWSEKQKRVGFVRRLMDSPDNPGALEKCCEREFTQDKEARRSQNVKEKKGGKRAERKQEHWENPKSWSFTRTDRLETPIFTWQSLYFSITAVVDCLSLFTRCYFLSLMYLASSSGVWSLLSATVINLVWWVSFKLSSNLSPFWKCDVQILLPRLSSFRQYHPLGCCILETESNAPSVANHRGLVMVVTALKCQEKQWRVRQ